jgi:hypothetical protein
MARDGAEAIGSMGTDTPLAVLSDRPRLLWDYFQQLFAQVTNPPLDAIREELVTSLSSSTGPEGNLLEPGPDACRQVALTFPIIDNDELETVYGLRSTRRARTRQPRLKLANASWCCPIATPTSSARQSRHCCSRQRSITT